MTVRKKPEPKVSSLGYLEAKIEAMKTQLDALVEKHDRRDLVLFGEDGRGGLVADVQDAKTKWMILGSFTVGVVFPLVVGIILWLVNRGG